jgi:hypothetical protein
MLLIFSSSIEIRYRLAEKYITQHRYNSMDIHTLFLNISVQIKKVGF